MIHILSSKSNTFALSINLLLIFFKSVVVINTCVSLFIDLNILFLFFSSSSLNDYQIKPIILLDDLFSELDEKNRNNIFKSINEDIQVFITTTDLKNINKKLINRAKIFNLDERT